MIGKLAEVHEAMQNGVFNFCVDGKCSGCGNCCSGLLPVSDNELDKIKRYIKRNNIKPCRHGVPHREKLLDMTCPFMDESKKDKKCRIYDVRPMICRTFQCNIPPSEIKENKERFWKNRDGFFMWELFDK